jgi:hypothetical protein
MTHDMEARRVVLKDANRARRMAQAIRKINSEGDGSIVIANCADAFEMLADAISTLCGAE